MTILQGKYRDILLRNNTLLVDTGWKSNKIMPGCGCFIAASFKKDFTKMIGLEYLVVGGPIDPALNKGDTLDDEKIKEYFSDVSTITQNRILEPRNYIDENIWVSAAKIESEKIKYKSPNPSNRNSNCIELEIKFFEKDLPDKSFTFFSLIAIELNGTSFDSETDKLYQINHVSHPLLTKDDHVSLTRNIVLSFPTE